MNLVAISCVKNEIDIIEAFVRHTLAIVNRLVVMDNGSTDGTLDVLRALEQDGLPLHILEDPSPGYTQWQRMTRLMREYALGRFDADWVIPLDADEFMVVNDDADLIPAGAATEQPIGLLWKTFVPGPEDDAREPNPVRRIRHRLLEEPSTWLKVMIPAALASHPAAAVQQGNHGVEVNGVLISPRVAEHACLAHFPGRGAGQLLAKIVIGHFQYATMVARECGWGSHYAAPFASIRQDPEQFIASFRETVLNYTLPPGLDFVPRVVEAPIPYRGGPLTHTPATADRSYGLRTIIDYVEGLARSHAVLSEARDRLAQTNSDLRQENTRLACELTTLRREKTELVENTRGLIEEKGRLLRDLDNVIKTGAPLVEALRRSWTWKVGRLIVGPAAWLKRLC
jgi:hypothetical protein